MRIACADTANQLFHSLRGCRMMAISFYNALFDWTVSDRVSAAKPQLLTESGL
jgi:hypothetical protein